MWSNSRYTNEELNTSIEHMSIGDYSTLLGDTMQPKIIVLLVQVGITILYIKEMGMDKLEIIVGEVG